MSKKTQTAAKDAVATAIIEQISAYSATSGKNFRALAWRVDAAKAILGIKTKEAKPTVTPKSADRLQSEIIAALSTFVKKSGVRKLQSIVKGETSLNDVVAGIATTISTLPQVAAPSEDEYNALLAKMNTTQLFEMLRVVSTAAPVATSKKTETTKTRAKGGYVSVDDETAYTIAAVYLTHYKKDKLTGARTNAPDCFLGKRCANATMALRRFLYSTICRDNCAIYNSMPIAVAEYYKAHPYNVAPHAGDKTYNPEKDLAALLEDASLRQMIESWKDEPYIAAVLKK